MGCVCHAAFRLLCDDRAARLALPGLILLARRYCALCSGEAEKKEMRGGRLCHFFLSGLMSVSALIIWLNHMEFIYIKNSTKGGRNFV